MVKLFDLKLVFTRIPKILRYLHINVNISLIALLIGLVLGLVIALVRIHKVPVLNRLAVLLVSVIRGTPIIVQLYVTYFGIPILLRYINYYRGTDYSLNAVPPVVYAIVALGINQAAFNSETIRAAILSVDKGQIEAATSLGMTGGQILKRVLIPQAMGVAIPSLGNSLINLIKGTSLVFTCGVVDMTAESRILSGLDYRYFEAYVSLAIIFWGVTIVLEALFRYLEGFFAIPEKAPETEAEPVPKWRRKLT